MLRITVVTMLIVAPLLAGATEPSNAPLVLDVWPGKTPQDSGIGEYGPIAPERVRDPADAPTKTATWVTGVTHPTLTIYRPSKGKNTGAAFIVCPGGGYWNLAWDLEGTEVAEWLRSQGITGIVLKYRVPRRAGEPEPLPAPVLSWMPSAPSASCAARPREWDIDPNHIGIGGFSAGGHLALAAATSFDRRMYAPLDAIDKVSCRPDFAVAAYPGYLVDIKTWELRPSIRIRRERPRSSWYTRSAIRSLAQARPQCRDVSGPQESRRSDGVAHLRPPVTTASACAKPLCRSRPGEIAASTGCATWAC
jgi:acetyl esterase/lipase